MCQPSGCRLFYGWLQARDPDRLLLYRTQEEMGDLRDRLAEAEDKATGLAAELADAHRRHAM
ncbi:hypothetical protein, partial [Streptomyces luteolifulvus]|uniref:hypothetical protein n=1 Tax=Streptomyces luteolifulvus TaxID=2615112 RepID=UPI001CD9C062